MNGKLTFGVLFVTALTVSVHGACDINACTSKATDFSKATTAADICKYAQAYIDCETVVVKECAAIDESVLDSYKIALSTNNCNSSGVVVFSMSCLFLCSLLHKLFN